jgi:hypothetical protein
MRKEQKKIQILVIERGSSERVIVENLRVRNGRNIFTSKENP